jgi:hypothetical protein
VDALKTYTVDGGPDLDHKIDEQLRGVVESVAKRVPASEFRALILGGGYGRGEGGALETSRGLEPYNDYDLVLIHESKDVRRLAAELSELGREQSRRCGIHVDVTPIHRARLAALPAALTWFELARGHRVLAGAHDALEPISNRTLSEVHPTEWGRLLFNRGAGLLFASWQLAGQTCSVVEDESFERFCTRQVAKAWLSLGDVWLADRGQYHPQVVERRKAWEAAGSVAPAWTDHYLAAVAFKLRPRLERPRAALVGELDLLRTLFGRELSVRSAAPFRPMAGLWGTFRSVASSRWLRSRPWRYPRERMRLALARELLGDSQERERLVGGPEDFVRAWQRYG